MKSTNPTLLDELATIDEALLIGEHTPEQELRGQELVQLANAAPKLLEALVYFFNIMHDYESSLQKDYIKAALEMAKDAIAEANGGAA